MGALKDKIKGKAMQVEGKLTDDSLRTAQGTVTEAKGDAESALDGVVRKVKRAARSAKTKVKSAARTVSAKARTKARSTSRSR